MVVEVRSQDESYTKLPFYAVRGVTEATIGHRIADSSSTPARNRWRVQKAGNPEHVWLSPIALAHDGMSGGCLSRYTEPDGSRRTFPDFGS